MSVLPSECRKHSETAPFIFLFGPTGVGKTALLEQLFTTGYEVVNADSKQVYRYLDIGSAKPEPEILQHIPHHLIDIKEPWEQFSVGEFVHRADAACEDIILRGQTPIICGGTAYYFKHFYYGLPKSPKSDPVIRDRIAQQTHIKGLVWVYERLQKIDPVSAEKIHPADGYRITRALEVYETSGKPLSSFSLPTEAREGVNPIIIGLHRDRSELQKRLEQRVASMFSRGLEQEVAALKARGATEDWPGMQGIGYKEFFIADKHPEMNSDDIAQLIVHNSRLYAKRQMTFFKSLPNVHWVHPENISLIQSLVNQAL